MGLRALWDLPAPAKLNLFLHVVGRRPDGYHLLQTAFQFLDLADVLLIHEEQLARYGLAIGDDIEHARFALVDSRVQKFAYLGRTDGTIEGTDPARDIG